MNLPVGEGEVVGVQRLPHPRAVQAPLPHHIPTPAPTGVTPPSLLLTLMGTGNQAPYANIASIHVL